MSAIAIQSISRRVLKECRKQGWAALESGISWPIPVLVQQEVRLAYLLYWSQLRGREQVIHEPFANVLASYPDGTVLKHEALQVHSPSKEIGKFPYDAVLNMTADERRNLWDELLDLYPGIIAAFAGWPTGSDEAQIKRFAHLFSLAVPPYLKSAYHQLNPKFFGWLNHYSE